MSETLENLNQLTLFCGGFPCQDLSVAGKRAGLVGERSGLWFEFLRIVALNRPRWIVIENVPGLLSSWSPVELPPDPVEGREWEVEENSDFEIIIAGLTELGYCVASRILDAQYDGVAQRRERVFIVGSLGDGSCVEILFESESVLWNPPTRGEAGQRVAATITERFAGGSNQWAPMNEADNLVATTLDQRGRGPTDAVMMNFQIAANNFGERQIATALSTKNERIDGDTETFVVAHALRSEGADASEDGTGRGTPLVVAEAVDVRNLRMQPDGTSGTLQHKKSGGYSLNYQNPICFSSKDHGADAGEISPTLRSQNFKDSHMNGGGQVAIAFAENQRGELRTSDVSPQLSCAGGKPGSGYPATAGKFGVRRLTPRECERLQSFPDDFTRWDANGKEISDSARYRMLGNAICVNVARWIGKRIVEAGS